MARCRSSGRPDRADRFIRTGESVAAGRTHALPNSASDAERAEAVSRASQGARSAAQLRVQGGEFVLRPPQRGGRQLFSARPPSTTRR